MADWTFLTCAMRTLPSSYQEVVPNSSVLKSGRATNRMWRKLCSLTLELGLQNDDAFALWTSTDMSKVLAAWSHHSVRKPRVWSATSAEVSASTTSHLSDGSRGFQLPAVKSPPAIKSSQLRPWMLRSRDKPSHNHLLKFLTHRIYTHNKMVVLDS